MVPLSVFVLSVLAQWLLMIVGVLLKMIWLFYRLKKSQKRNQKRQQRMKIKRTTLRTKRKL